MYIEIANKWKKAFNVPNKYGLCIEHGNFMLHMGFGNGIYIQIGSWCCQLIGRYRGWKYKNGKVYYDM